MIEINYFEYGFIILVFNISMGIAFYFANKSQKQKFEILKLKSDILLLEFILNIKKGK